MDAHEDGPRPRRFRAEGGKVAFDSNYRPRAWSSVEVARREVRDQLALTDIVVSSLEDETGISNIIVSPPLFEANRLLIISEPFLLIEGVAEARNGTVHVKAEKFDWIDFRLATSPSHDFG